MTIRHLPVLMREVIDLLSIVEGGIYVDATIGLGGHAEAILQRVGKEGKVIGVDRDAEALRMTAGRLRDSRLVLKKGTFSELETLLASQDVGHVDGLLFDLGVSMMQLKDLKRGFSFHSPERLNMRMDAATGPSAWDVVNRYSEKELTRILKEYGEEHAAPRIARAIVRYRGKKRVDTCAELEDIVFRAAGRRGKVHPATKTFQALRIEVNREIRELEEGLASSLKMLKSGGRLCVISYHSLEDRTVKNFIRDNAKKGVLHQLLKKPITPTLEEIRENPSSRSAKLRGAERL
jgi:16S rRNA (cytosine1402-N4)-methyltransferase